MTRTHRTLISFMVVDLVELNTAIRARTAASAVDIPIQRGPLPFDFQDNESRHFSVVFSGFLLCGVQQSCVDRNRSKRPPWGLRLFLAQYRTM